MGIKAKLGSLLAVGISTLCLFTTASADWHIGTVTRMGHGYDGQTITFKLSGWERSNCTCYSSWSDQMCLDRTRTSFAQDYAWLLRARTTGQQVQVNIDETTCRIVALFELD